MNIIGKTMTSIAGVAVGAVTTGVVGDTTDNRFVSTGAGIIVGSLTKAIADLTVTQIENSLLKRKQRKAMDNNTENIKEFINAIDENFDEDDDEYDEEEIEEVEDDKIEDDEISEKDYQNVFEEHMDSMVNAGRKAIKAERRAARKAKMNMKKASPEFVEELEKLTNLKI